MRAGRFLAWTALAAATAGCGGRPNEPVALANAYFQALADGRPEAQYRLLAPAVRKIESYAEFGEVAVRSGMRRKLVKFELQGKSPKTIPDPWRAFFRMTWQTSEGKKEQSWQGITVARRGGRWWILDTPVTRADASESYVAGDYARATRLLYRILRFNPTDAESLDLLGYVVRDNPVLKNNLELAIEAHRQAAELEPKNPDWHLSLGNDYRLLGWYGGAVTELKRAVELEPRANYYMWLGVAYAAAQQVESARGAMRQALKLDPGNAQAHAFLEKIR